MKLNRWNHFALVAAILVVSVVAFADRTDIWSNSSVKVYQVELMKLPDAGCAVQAWATYTKSDGGIANEPSAITEVAGVNRTDCLNIIDVRAPVLFKAEKGL